MPRLYRAARDDPFLRLASDGGDGFEVLIVVKDGQSRPLGYRSNK